MYINFSHYIWRLPSLSELTLMIINTGLIHLGSDYPYYKVNIDNKYSQNVCIIFYESVIPEQYESN